VIQATGDADADIARTACNLASEGRVVNVVADDTDVLVLLVHHFKSATMADIYMSSSRKSGQNSERKVVSIRSIQFDIDETAVEQLLVVHALTGCDTTSALFGQGKRKAFNKLAKSKIALPLSRVIMNKTATEDEVAQADCQLLVMLYGGKATDTLNKLRHTMYSSMCVGRKSRPVPERLPPTERAAHFHCLRAHYQVVQWETFMAGSLEVCKWGWHEEESGC